MIGKRIRAHPNFIIENQKGDKDMLEIRCPNCEEMAFLSLASWEDFIGLIRPGKPVRIGLICSQCHKDFLLQVRLTEVMPLISRRSSV